MKIILIKIWFYVFFSHKMLTIVLRNEIKPNRTKKKVKTTQEWKKNTFYSMFRWWKWWSPGKHNFNFFVLHCPISIWILNGVYEMYYNKSTKWLFMSRFMFLFANCLLLILGSQFSWIWNIISYAYAKQCAE